MATARVSRSKRKDETARPASSGEMTVAQAIEAMELEEAMYRPLASAVTAQQAGSGMMDTAQAIGAQPMVGARGMGDQPMETANTGKRKVKRSAPAGADIYDERIGGYGRSMGPQESGEQAVQRIRRVRRGR